MNKNFKLWLNLLASVNENYKSKCPICNKYTINFVYKGDEETT